MISVYGHGYMIDDSIYYNGHIKQWKKVEKAVQSVETAASKNLVL
jgi:hypothetical protein